MAEYIDLDAKVYATFYDEQYEEWSLKSSTVRNVLSAVCDDLPPAANVRENSPVTLRLETEGIDGHPTWYRKRFYCPKCGLLIRTESWNEKRCFGMGTCLRQNIDPNFCPNCGAKMEVQDG